VSEPTRVPPSCSATLLPPAASDTVRTRLETPIVPSTTIVVSTITSG
jgi:hypothetical protein